MKMKRPTARIWSHPFENKYHTNYWEGKRTTGLILVKSLDEILFKLIFILYSSFIKCNFSFLA